MSGTGRRLGIFAACMFAVTASSVVVIASGSEPIAAEQESPFPHADHQGLFPLCTGCHAGVPSGDLASWYPDPASCASCHDGVRRPGVAWNGPSSRVDNVSFDHPDHARTLDESGDAAVQCASCHVAPGGGRMDVSADLQVATCWACHAHSTDDHYDPGATCTTCHVPLASTRFDRLRIEALPKPASHEADGFVLEGHGALAPGREGLCATCHTQERCTTCHLDPGLPSIAAMPTAPPEMELPEVTAHYPEPVSHTELDWPAAHADVRAAAECSTCHTADDCRSCHLESEPEIVGRLASRSTGGAPGVGLEGQPPESHGSAFFMQAHSVLASADAASCQTCHVERFCVECHAGPVGSGYHPPNFMVRHAGDAYGRDAECVNCHQERVFCRACHADLGLAGQRRANAGYHDGSSLWLLRHGQAARQGLESCASCHKQVDCTRCHGVLGAFKVSPHPRDFDAAAAWVRSPRTCLACHVGNPTGGGGP